MEVIRILSPEFDRPGLQTLTADREPIRLGGGLRYPSAAAAVSLLYFTSVRLLQKCFQLLSDINSFNDRLFIVIIFVFN